MKRTRLGRILASAVLLGAALSFSVPASPASAKAVKPTVSTWAWYWEEADSRDVELPAGTVTGDTNNEFCPQVPGGGLGNVSEETCAEGRLPVRIKGGNYDKPNQTSAIIFDTLTTIPLESKVHKFTATFLEAKAGCRDKETTSPSGKQCEQTDPINVEGHELQACMVTQLFGEGAARPYKEIPNHKCTKSDPIAKRKKIKLKGEERFEWTFDLKRFAQKWADGDVLSSAVLLTGAEPKNSGPQDSWRVVLEGPLEKNGIEVKAEITEPPPIDIDPIDPTDPPVDDVFVPGDPGTPGIPGTPGTPGTDPTTSSTDPGTGDTPTGATEPGDATAPVDAVEEPPNEQAAADGPAGGGLPGYAWLALLAGIAGFSLLRRAVLETHSGIRPDGVLAQIQKLNAQRRGGSAAASYAPPAALAALLSVAGLARNVTKSITSKVSTVAGKLSRKKGS